MLKALSLKLLSPTPLFDCNLSISSSTAAYLFCLITWTRFFSPFLSFLLKEIFAVHSISEMSRRSAINYHPFKERVFRQLAGKLGLLHISASRTQNQLF